MTESLAGPDRFTVRRRPFDYRDPHLDDDADGVRRELRALEEIAATHYGDHAGAHRKRSNRIDMANPATARLAEALPSAAHWMSQIPTAAALHPLYDPKATHYTTGVPIDPEIRKWFNNIADAQGIRSRANAMIEILTAATGSPDSPRWLSLACGAAQPVFAAARELRHRGRATPYITLADLDPQALRLASHHAHEYGLAQNATFLRANVLDPRGFTGARRPGRRLAGYADRFDAVDAVGLLEYLAPQDWTYTYNRVITTRRRLAGAVTFVRNAFACVRPGGVLILGNMLDSHPELGFTMNVIQWPHIQPRSVDQMLGIFKAAGVTGHIDIHLPTDGVYAIYAVHKPPRGELTSTDST